MSKVVKVLQFSTHNEECGIAKYQEQFVASMNGSEGFVTEYFPYSPNKTKQMGQSEFKQVMQELDSMLVNFDILHIQHELSFFKHSELAQIIGLCKRKGKKVMVTVHTAPHAQYIPPRLGGVGPRSFARFIKSKLSAKRFVTRYISPLAGADLILVHNNQTKLSLESFGVPKGIINIIRIPVPQLDKSRTSVEIKEHLSLKKDDIVYCTVGFLSRMKGVTHAVKALSLLPDNYKLAIIGGNHPDTLDPSFYDEVVDLIVNLKLQDRVYITGYVVEDDRLNALIRECDVCIYPFDTNYYSYVSSASLNNAFANHKPVVAYSTKTFTEINEQATVINFCKSPNYYELARELQNIDIPKAEEESRKYAEAYNYDKEASSFIEIYRTLVSGS